MFKRTLTGSRAAAFSRVATGTTPAQGLRRLMPEIKPSASSPPRIRNVSRHYEETR